MKRLLNFKISFTSFVLALTALVFPGIVMAQCVNQADADSYQVPNTSCYQIDGKDGACRQVTNNHATGRDLFVPNKTAAEWTSFRTNPPPGVTVTSPCTCVAGNVAYATAGTFQWNVPGGCTQMTVYTWGAGGGGGGGPTQAAGNGGAGGYVTRTVAVTELENIDVEVGTGGGGGSTGCAAPGVGGAGTYDGGSGVLNTVGGDGIGVATGGNGGAGHQGGTAGGNGEYGGGGGGSAVASGLGAGGGSATVISRSGVELTIAGGGGGGGAKNASGGTSGAGGAGCAGAGVAASGGGNEKGGGGGGGDCLTNGGTEQNGTGTTPFAIAVPAALPPAANAGGGISAVGATCGNGEPGYVRIDYQ